MRLLRIAARTLAWSSLSLVVLLLSCQSRLIYHPRPYDRSTLWDLEQRQGRRVEFTTSQGAQTAFYLPPRGQAGAAPAFLWIVCGGNGSLALDYAGEPLRWDERFGYLFVDYPGYGLCKGTPNPKSIEENVVGAAETLRRELGWSEAEFCGRTAAFGHSIGCAAALMGADTMHLRGAVLCAPFTTMTDMGRRVLGWPLCYLNLHRFDNVARLRVLHERGTPVRLFHGTQDEVIPVGMSRTMAAHFTRTVELNEVTEGHHNDVVQLARESIGTAMLELSGKR